ncbi:MAG: FKBP-type peptidyl-prolyl cis-trans isomerase, partial [Desulfocapsaceae bacterium]|nr:FKBP-type peptidyl-prolyl cis-trans isomerase [Desulfocapsaceae bacterium]
KPVSTDTVKVDYVGTLVDGTEFDSSIKRGEPAVFGVDQVIPGWSEALQLMEVGSKYRVAIPSELAYGEAGAPPVIQPNSVLVFEIDLLGIEEGTEEKQ